MPIYSDERNHLRYYSTRQLCPERSLKVGPLSIIKIPVYADSKERISAARKKVESLIRKFGREEDANEGELAKRVHHVNAFEISPLEAQNPVMIIENGRKRRVELLAIQLYSLIPNNQPDPFKNLYPNT